MSVPGTNESVRVDTSVRRVLVALPSLHLVAAAFPNAERRMLTNIPVVSRAPAAAAVLGESGLIHSYETYTLGVRRPFDLAQMLRRLRRFRPQVIVYLKAVNDFATARRDAAYLRLTGAKRIVGLPTSPEDYQMRLEPDGTFEPESYRLARSLKILGDADVQLPSSWNLRLGPTEYLRADAALQVFEGRPFFAVSVGTKVQAKDWGIGNWRELLRALAIDYPGYGLLLAGAAEECLATDAAAEGWRSVPGAGPTVNVCGMLLPRESAAAFRNARVFIGHDSGPMHLSAVMGVPTVTVFAARNQPRTWFPVSAPHRVIYHRVDCWGCGLETCVEQRKKCILSITVQEVMDGVHEFIAPVSRGIGTDVVRSIAAAPDAGANDGEVPHVA